MPSLVRTRDGAGDSGPMSEALKYENGKIICVGRKPKVGAVMRVGSPYVRSYQGQDYWTTTPVTEILEERPGYTRFKTGNSEYEWTD